MRNVVFILFIVLIGSSLMASVSWGDRFIDVGSYEISNSLIVCNGQNPHIQLTTKYADMQIIKFSSPSVCHHYLQLDSHIINLYSCNNNSQVNRYIIDEIDGSIKHALQPNKLEDCEQDKRTFIKRFFFSQL